MERSDEALVDVLGDRITGEPVINNQWVTEVKDLLSRQSSDTLAFLESETKDWPAIYCQALDASISSYLYEHEFSTYPYPEESTLSEDEFILRLAVALVPVSVEHNLPSLNAAPVLGWDGQYSGTDEESLCQSVSAEVGGMFDSLTPNDKSLRLCRGYFLNGVYGGGRLADHEFQWIHDHALDVLGSVDDFFRGGRFDLGVALEMTSVETEPLRTGVL